MKVIKLMSTKRIKSIVKTWFEGEYTMFDCCVDEPEIAWQAILEILQHDLTVDQEALLAGGALETLLSWHGEAFIDRVVNEARSNQKFGHLLGGVWRQEMADDIWQRIERERTEAW